MPKLPTKDKLLKVATRLFAQKGYKGVTIREISKAANASIPMVSYYFGGKEALYSAILQQQFSCYSDLDEQMKVKTDPLVKIRDYIIWSLTKHRNNEYFSKLYIREIISPTKHHETFIKPLLAKSFGYLHCLIDDCKNIGIINTDIDTNAVTTMMATTLNYVGFYDDIDTRISDFVDRDVNEIAEIYMKIFFEGISVVNQKQYFAEEE
jgi:TetR/AcrR family transcriptional regulator